MRTNCGKPRLMVIVQDDDLATYDTVPVCLITSEMVPALRTRIDVEPSWVNGLTKPSQIQADKNMPDARGNVREVVGQLEDERMRVVEGAVLSVLGFDPY